MGELTGSPQLNAVQPIEPAASGAAPRVESPTRHVLFRVGKERFALPLDAIREVVNPQPPFARVPRTSDAVRGAMNLRGRVVAVVDLAPMVGLAPQPTLAAGSGQVIILDRDRRSLGLLISAVLGVEVFQSPERIEGGNKVARGVISVRQEAVTVLDADGIADDAAALFGGR